MNSVKLEIENIKCGGCAKTVEKSLHNLQGINSIMVDVEAGTVTFESEENSDESTLEQLKEEVIKELANAGYPLKGTGNSWQKAKSYVSCAKGKLS
jgi:copper chaperone